LEVGIEFFKTFVRRQFRRFKPLRRRAFFPQFRFRPKDCVFFLRRFFRKAKERLKR
jgi:hypothetical protein